MLEPGFFGFCTTLKPLELKAHRVSFPMSGIWPKARPFIPPATPATPSSSSIAGVVEVIQPSAQNPRRPPTCRAATFSATSKPCPVSRANTWCAPASRSVCNAFQRKDFPELIRRVPSFFHYLSTQLAFRLSQAQRSRGHPEPLPRAERKPGELRSHHDLPDDRQLFADRPAPHFERERRN